MQVCVNQEHPLNGKICYNEWTVYILFMSSIEDIESYLKDINCPSFLIQDAINTMSQNFGFTYSNFNSRESVIYINKPKSIGDFFNTLSHECTHLIEHMDRIHSFGSEQKATIFGNLFQMILENFYL